MDHYIKSDQCSSFPQKRINLLLDKILHKSQEKSKPGVPYFIKARHQMKLIPEESLLFSPSGGVFFVCFFFCNKIWNR